MITRKLGIHVGSHNIRSVTGEIFEALLRGLKASILGVCRLSLYFVQNKPCFTQIISIDAATIFDLFGLPGGRE